MLLSLNKISDSFSKDVPALAFAYDPFLIFFLVYLTALRYW
jgi:hypothetical protein